MKIYLNIFFFLITLFGFAQKKTSPYKVTYNLYENDKKTENEISFICDNGMAYLSKAESRIQQYIDFNKKENISTINFEGKVYKKVTSFASLPEGITDERSKPILGYSCGFASFTYFSNKIEIWYTEDAKAKGSPYSNYLTTENALVMELSVNGSKRLSVKSIEKVAKFYPTNSISGNEIEATDAEFEELKINSRFVKLSVFNNEIINFDPSILPAQNSNLAIDSVYHFSKGTVLMKKIKLTEKQKNSESIFATLHCKSNGDAYDRTGSVFIVPVDDKSVVSVLTAYQFGVEKLPVFTDNDGNKYQGITQEKNYAPPIELMRFYTSFGANYFNDKRQINNYDWVENVSYKQDVSDLIPSNTDEFWVGIFIGNYDKGGHIVSLELDFHPAYDAKDSLPNEKYISSLFSTVNTLEMSGQNYGSLFGNDTLKMNFTVPENIENLELLFTSTGHGGWGGGDEFNPKMNQVFIDGEEIFKIAPWRTDCATYRLSNPASGNFENGLSSSDLSRSNWCPATLTPPYVIPLKSLKSGLHSIEVIIDQGEKEGGNSSHWNVTGILTGTHKPEKGR